MNEQSLQQSWQTLLTHFGVDAATAIAAWAMIRTYYQAADRHYHNLAHIAACLDSLTNLPPLPDKPVIELALWFHDVVYDPQAHDSEARSAEFASDELLGWGVTETVAEQVAGLILATEHRIRPATASAAQMVDCDLAILGALPAAYDRYAEAIRLEYAWASPRQYAVGRRQVIDRFLQQDSIYHTETGRSLWEKAARANLNRERAQLSD